MTVSALTSRRARVTSERREVFGAAALGPLPERKSGCDGDEAVGGELVGDGRGPSRRAPEDFVEATRTTGALSLRSGVSDDVGFEGGFWSRGRSMSTNSPWRGEECEAGFGVGFSGEELGGGLGGIGGAG